MGWPNAEPHAVAAQANRVRRQGLARIPRPMTFLAKDFKRGEKVSLISKRNADGGRPKRRVRSAYRPPPNRPLRVTRFGGHERLAPPIRAAPAVSYDYRPNCG